MKREQPQRITRYTPDPEQGLTAAQAEERRKQGLQNTDSTISTKSIGRIVKDNACTLFNLVITALGVAVLLTGSHKNLLFMGVMLINLVIGIAQEIRTKRTIDRLSVLWAVKASVIRDGVKRELPVDDVVLDDVAEYVRGSQIVADSVVLSGMVSMNESLVTGESDPIQKRSGEMLLSGSFVVNGRCRARVERVGAENYAARITNGAGNARKPPSEIMKSLQKIIRAVSIAIFPIGVLLFLNQINLDGNTFRHAVVSTAAALVGMIPEGLVLLTSSVLAVSVVRLSRQKVMVQELYCIETLARVDVLCLDKTGTITEGRMELTEVIPLEGTAMGEAELAMTAYCKSVEDDSPTFQAVAGRFRGEGEQSVPDETVPFSSETKWSGVWYEKRGCLIFGAPEMILGEGVKKYRELLSQKLQENRVLLLAHSKGGFCGGGLPRELRPLAFFVIRDVIRPDAPQTLRYFEEQGVRLKVISGDNPVTVSTIAKRAGLKGAGQYVDASTLETQEALREAVGRYTVFGRVSPLQKKQMVLALKEQGHTVAMTGDGVNDVLALSEADCSVAVASGSEAARNVAQLVLLDSNFSAMPQVVAEGRRSINNLERSASLFLVKTIFSCCLAVLFLLLPQPYPFLPIQLTLVSSLTIGFPSFVLALEPNHELIRGGFLQNVVSRAAPSAITIVLHIFALSVLSPWLPFTRAEISTLCVFLTGFTGVLLLYRLCAPFDPLRRILFGTICAGLMIAVTLFRDFFSLSAIDTRLFPAVGALFLSCFLFFELCYLAGRRKAGKESPDR